MSEHLLDPQTERLRRDGTFERLVGGRWTPFTPKGRVIDPGRAAARETSAEDELAELTVEELRARARALEISGFSSMRKTELVAAVAAATEEVTDG